MKSKVLLDKNHLNLTITRLCHQLIENHSDFNESVIIGLQPRGTLLANRIHKVISELLKKKDIPIGNLDVTFHRDDFRRKSNPLLPNTTKIDFLIEDKKVILIDDVFFTGRTIRSGLDALMAYGRPKKVELLVLINRRFNRHLPIEPDYIGKTVDSIESEKVKVNWKETENKDEVILYTPTKSDE